MQHIDYNLLYRWFVGLNMDDKVWDHSILGDRPRFSLLQTQGAVQSAICVSCSAYMAWKRGDASEPGMNPAGSDEMRANNRGRKLGPRACDCGNFPPKIQAFILLTFDHVPEISHSVALCRAGHGGAGQLARQ